MTPSAPNPAVDLGDRGLDDLTQHDLTLKIAAHRHDGLQQRVPPVTRGQHRLQVDWKLGEQFVELRQWSDRTGI